MRKFLDRLNVTGSVCSIVSLALGIVGIITHL